MVPRRDRRALPFPGPLDDWSQAARNARRRRARCDPLIFRHVGGVDGGPIRPKTDDESTSSDPGSPPLPEPFRPARPPAGHPPSRGTRKGSSTCPDCPGAGSSVARPPVLLPSLPSPFPVWRQPSPPTTPQTTRALEMSTSPSSLASATCVPARSPCTWEPERSPTPTGPWPADWREPRLAEPTHAKESSACPPTAKHRKSRRIRSPTAPTFTHSSARTSRTPSR